jgi:hypothetical protein
VRTQFDIYVFLFFFLYNYNLSSSLCFWHGVLDIFGSPTSDICGINWLLRPVGFLVPKTFMLFILPIIRLWTWWSLFRKDFIVINVDIYIFFKHHLCLTSWQGPDSQYTNGYLIIDYVSSSTSTYLLISYTFVYDKRNIMSEHSQTSFKLKL